LSLQEDHKSQSVLLRILDGELIETFNISLKNCGTSSKKYALYIDDMLATGGTIFEDCMRWLKIENKDGEQNFNKIIKQEKILVACIFCIHT
jgi:phosphoribosylpyrophosphate synthetase